jgi:hypothetical protein
LGGGVAMIDLNLAATCLNFFKFCLNILNIEDYSVISLMHFSTLVKLEKRKIFTVAAKKNRPSLTRTAFPKGLVGNQTNKTPILPNLQGFVSRRDVILAV